MNLFLRKHLCMVLIFLLCLIPITTDGQDLNDLNILTDDPEFIEKALSNPNFNTSVGELRDLAFSFEMIAYAEYDPSDYNAVWYPTEGSRGLCAGSDLDEDGRQEIFAVHYGNGSGVVGFEMNGSGALEMIWNSVLSPTSYNLGTRFVQTADIDDDGYGEIIFFRGRYADDPNRGLYIYEWDGSDNGYVLAYHNTFATLGGDFISEMVVEHFLIDDIDGDGLQELVFANNGPSMGEDRSEDFFSILSISGDIGSGAEILTEEYWISPRDVDRDGIIDDALGGGSGLNVQVCDTDGDGFKEVFCHPYNYFNMFFFEATGPDSYTLGDTSNILLTYPVDDAQLMNAAVSDMDHDGADEIYVANWLSGDVYRVKDTDGDATSLLPEEVDVLGAGVGAKFGALAFDFDSSGTDEIYFGSSANLGADIRVWDGEEFTAYQSDPASDGFLPKMAVADMNGNGIPELITAHQGVTNYPQRIIRVLEYLPDDPNNPRWSFTSVNNIGYTDDWGNSYAPILGDYDRDGDLDVFVTNGGYQQNTLYANTGSGWFDRIWGSDITYDSYWSNTATWGDYDNDGDLDLFVANSGDGDPNNLYENLGGDNFQRIYQGSIVTETDHSRSASWGDYNNDGLLDLYVGNGGESNRSNSLFSNNGDGTFDAVGTGWIVFDTDESNSVSWVDYDNDGDLDMYVANCGSNALYRNAGDGSFVKIQTGVLVEDDDCSNGASWADYDNDGDLDVFVTTESDSPNRLYENLGGGDFQEITTGTIVTDVARSLGSAWGDLDNDGDLDLFVANNAEPNLDDNFLYLNQGDGTFVGVYDNLVNFNDEWAVGCAWGDYNQDGALDLFVGIDGGRNLLFANQGNANAWVSIRCVGTESNRAAIGAKVRVKANIHGIETWQMNELSGQTGGYGQNSLNAEFGLGDATVIDSLRIEWPSGLISEYSHIEVEEFYTIQEGPALEVNTDTLDWGEVYLGSAHHLMVELSNYGPTPVLLSDVISDNPAFSTEGTTFQIDPGEITGLPVIFEPETVGLFEGLLTFSSSDPDVPNGSIVLLGYAVLAPDISVSTDSLFVELLPGASATRMLVIDNNLGESVLSWSADLETGGADRIYTFTKTDYADWQLSENQDRITDNVWITRANSQGPFNAALESEYSWNESPWDTEWSYGYTEDLEPEDYEDWRSAIDSNPPGMIGQPMSVHLISDDIYLDIEFHSWTPGGNGGGFSYTRTATEPEWVTQDLVEGALGIGESDTLTISFNALALPPGLHTAELVIGSNDPDESVIVIPIGLQVAIAPDIFVENDTLDFGNVFNGYSDTLGITLENLGSADLEVTAVSANPTEFEILEQAFTIFPASTYLLEVALTPSAAGIYSGEMILTTSDPDEEFFSISLLGSSLDPPIVGVSPDSLRADLFTDELEIQNMTITNTGLSDLVYEIRSASVESIERDLILSDPSQVQGPRFAWEGFQLDGSFQSQFRDFNWGRSGKPGPRAGTQPVQGEVRHRDLRESWQLLYTDPLEGEGIDIQFVYGSVTADELLIRVEPIGEYDEYFFVLYMDIDQNTETGIDTEEDGMGWYMGVDNAIVSTSWGFEGFFVMDEVAQEFILIDTLTTAIFDPSGAEAIVGVDMAHFEDRSAINFSLVAETDYGEEIVPDFGSGHITFTLGTAWLDFAPEIGAIPAGGQEVIEVTFDAAEMFGGEYFSAISVLSNDPASPEVVARAHLTVTGIPNIEIAEPSYSFGEIFVGFESELFIEVLNTGTDSLHLTSITVDNPLFEITPLATTIAHSESAMIRISVTPEATGTYPAQITIVSDDPDNSSVSVPVTAYVLVAPDIELDRTSLVHNLHGNADLRDTIIISNSGGSDLDYVIYIQELGGSRDAGGPDEFGYSWKDSNEPDGPEYDWVDASGGQVIYLSDDDWVGNVHMGFEFEYYGQTYELLNIMSNGWMSFTSVSSWYPDIVPYYDEFNYGGAIAPFGGDLYPPEGLVTVLRDGSAPDRRFIVEYNNVSWCCSGPPFMTFQVIFYERNNRIKFQYQERDGSYPIAVGIANEDNTMGLGNGAVAETFIDPGTIENAYAIEFYTGIDWVSVEPELGTIPAGSTSILDVHIDATTLDNGSYEAQLSIHSNDPEFPQLTVPVLVYLQGVGVDDGLEIPDTYVLKQNYPNPFNPTTTIRYGLPETSDVSLVIYDLKGRVVQSYQHKDHMAGWVDVSWNGTNSRGEAVSTGVYLCRMFAGDYSKTIKMVYMK